MRVIPQLLSWSSAWNVLLGFPTSTLTLHTQDFHRRGLSLKSKPMWPGVTDRSSVATRVIGWWRVMILRASVATLPRGSDANRKLSYEKPLQPVPHRMRGRTGFGRRAHVKNCLICGLSMKTSWNETIAKLISIITCDNHLNFLLQHEDVVWNIRWSSQGPHACPIWGQRSTQRYLWDCNGS